MAEAGTRNDGIRITRSAVEVISLAASVRMPGVAAVGAAGRCGDGIGAIRYTADGLAWRAPGSAEYGPGVLISVDGVYLLEDGEDASKWLRVTAYRDAMQIGAEAEVELSEVWGGVCGADITAAEAQAGNVLVYSLAIENVSPMDALEVVMWRTADELELSADGSTWVKPDSETHNDVLRWPRIASGGSETFYLRRTIAPGTAANAGVLDMIQIRWIGY